MYFFYEDRFIFCFLITLPTLAKMYGMTKLERIHLQLTSEKDLNISIADT